MTAIAKRLAALAALAALLLIPAASASAGTVPSGFQESVVFSGFTEPTSLAFSPDGRIFVAEKSGVIKVFDSASDPTPDVFANLSHEVYNYWDRGLLGMALDPDFPAQPYVYVLYTLDAKPGGAVPAWGGSSLGDPCPTPPGPTADGCVATGRLSKLTASGNSMTAETPLITDWCQQFPSHSVGDLAFGADGSLYVSGGEGASFNYEDWGQSGNPVNPCGDPPGGVGGAMTPPTAEGGSLRAQDVRTPADPTGLSGALLKIDPDSGQGAPGNPFAASADANARRILAFGLRNPFRFAIHPGSGEVWIGDVGSGHWEEIDRVVDPASGAASNFGWPCYEGDNSSSLRLFPFDAANLNLCESLYSQGASAVASPYFSYNHADKVVSGESCATGSSSIAGMAFYQAGPYPNAYNGALFFADYSRNCIWAMLPGANGLPDRTKIQTFDAGAEGPDNLKVGPDGALWFTDLNSGKVWRIGHSDGNQPPAAAISASPKNGSAPLDVQFSAAGSSDPDPGDTLSYSWDFDGDGQFGESAQAAPSHTYAQDGDFDAAVRVSDPDGASDTESVSIHVGNSPPVASLTAPSASLAWKVGDQIPFAATASDTESGNLPASAFKWRLLVHHCPSNCHVHQIETVAGVRSGSFVAPDHEYPSWLEIELTVTDSGGLTDTESVNVLPETVSVQLQSLPAPGFELAIAGTTVVAPGSKMVIKGSNNTVSAPAQTLNGTSYAFGAWSDGGAASHNFTANQDLTLTAVFGPPAAPAIASVSPVSPSSNNDPVVKGTVGADFPASVKLFANGSCSGAAAATVSPGQFSGAGVAVHVPSDATTQISAATTNAAGSTCSGAVAYTEDSTKPTAPTLTTTPLSPANDNTPKVSGSAEAGSQVRIFKSASCTGTPAASGSAAEFSAGIELGVADNSATSLTANATDAAGNTSPCSPVLVYSEDSTLPEAPTIAATAPPSPANDNSPEAIGSAPAGTSVRVYASANCSGPAVLGSAADFAAGGLSVAVADDTTTPLTATAADPADNVSACSEPFDYSEDSTAPAAPRILSSLPLSPANENQPRLTIDGEPGTGVELHTAAGCGGPVAMAVPASEFATGRSVQVADDSTTIFSAAARDAAGNVSACSSPFVYREDSTAPAPPRLAIAPLSPANDNGPRASGEAEDGSVVAIHSTADCSGRIATVNPAADLAAGLTLAVADDSVTPFAATATDDAGNRSACSAPLTYVEDSVAPQTSITRGPAAKAVAARRRSRHRPRQFRAAFAFAADDSSASFRCRFDGAAPAPCTSPLLRRNLKVGSHSFSVYAVDRAGNADATPAARHFKLAAPQRHRRR